MFRNFARSVRLITEWCRSELVLDRRVVVQAGGSVGEVGGDRIPGPLGARRSGGGRTSVHLMEFGSWDPIGAATLDPGKRGMKASSAIVRPAGLVFDGPRK